MCEVFSPIDQQEVYFSVESEQKLQRKVKAHFLARVTKSFNVENVTVEK